MDAIVNVETIIISIAPKRTSTFVVHDDFINTAVYSSGRLVTEHPTDLRAFEWDSDSRTYEHDTQARINS